MWPHEAHPANKIHMSHPVSVPHANGYGPGCTPSLWRNKDAHKARHISHKTGGGMLPEEGLRKA